MISWVFAYVQTHQVVHIIYVQFLVYQLYLNKAVIKKKKILWAKRNVSYLVTVSPGFNYNKPQQLCPTKNNLCFLCSGGLTPTYPTFIVCLIFR